MLDFRLFSMLHLLEMYLLKKLMQMGNLSGLKTNLMRYFYSFKSAWPSQQSMTSGELTCSLVRDDSREGFEETREEYCQTK